MQEIQETQVWTLGQEDPLEKEMATHSSILAWKIPWSEEPGELRGHKELDTTDTHTVYVYVNSKLLICSPALSPLVTMFVRKHHFDNCSPSSGRKNRNGLKEP